MNNTLLANNTGLNDTGNCGIDGTLTDGGGNLEDGNSCGFQRGVPPKSNTDPLLGTLGNYGGGTQTFPLLPGSPAIDAGDSATCAAAVVHRITARAAKTSAA